jgi:hypothetical protein
MQHQVDVANTTKVGTAIRFRASSVFELDAPIAKHGRDFQPPPECRNIATKRRSEVILTALEARQLRLGHRRWLTERGLGQYERKDVFVLADDAGATGNEVTTSPLPYSLDRRSGIPGT